MLQSIEVLCLHVEAPRLSMEAPHPAQQLGFGVKIKIFILSYFTSRSNFPELLWFHSNAAPISLSPACARSRPHHRRHCAAAAPSPSPFVLRVRAPLWCQRPGLRGACGGGRRSCHHRHLEEQSPPAKSLALWLRPQQRSNF